MRRKDREMPGEFAYEVIDHSPFGTLSTVNEDGTPYCIPVSAVRAGDSLYFHCAHQGQKVANLRRRPEVCLSFVSYAHIPQGRFTTEYESAVVFGAAREITEDQEKIEALRRICLRYTPDNMAAFEGAVSESLGRTALWRIDIKEISGKRKKYDSAGVEMKFGRMK